MEKLLTDVAANFDRFLVMCAIHATRAVSVLLVELVDLENVTHV